jgi:hypothetical protein
LFRLCSNISGSLQRFFTSICRQSAFPASWCLPLIQFCSTAPRAGSSSPSRTPVILRCCYIIGSGASPPAHAPRPHPLQRKLTLPSRFPSYHLCFSPFIHPLTVERVSRARDHGELIIFVLPGATSVWFCFLFSCACGLSTVPQICIFFVPLFQFGFQAKAEFN